MRTASRTLLLSLAAVVLVVALLMWFVAWVEPPAKPGPGGADDDILIPRQPNSSCLCRHPCRCVERSRPRPGQRCPCCGR